MQIRIALIGSRPMLDRVSKLATAYGEAQWVPYPYEQPEQAGQLAREAWDCDVLLFTGPIPYSFARAYTEQNGIPAVYVPFDEYMIALSLYDLRQALREVDPISIDIPQEADALSVLRELGLSAERFHIKPYFTTELSEDASVNIEEIVEFHVRLARSGQSSLALTGIQAVHTRLQTMGIPSQRMHIPEKNIQGALAEALARGQLLISSNAQIAVGFVSVDPYESLARERGSYAAQEATLKVHQLLLQLGKHMDASLQQISPDRFVLYGTRGGVHTVTVQMRELPLLAETVKLAAVSISVGFGYGATAREAEQHAEIALHHARQAGGGKAFIVTDDKTVVGPLDEERRSYQLRSEHTQTMELADRSGLSVATISKLLEFWRLRQSASFSVQEVAEYQQVQRRTAERIVKKLLDSGALRVAGEEQPFRKGKPRSLYQFNL